VPVVSKDSVLEQVEENELEPAIRGFKTEVVVVWFWYITSVSAIQLSLLSVCMYVCNIY